MTQSDVNGMLIPHKRWGFQPTFKCHTNRSVCTLNGLL